MYKQEDPTGASVHDGGKNMKCRRCGEIFFSEHGEIFCSPDCEKSASKDRRLNSLP